MKRIKYIALALVLMLGLIGGAYAYWQDTLTVEGTVNTGVMQVEWENFYLRTPENSNHSGKELPEYVDAANTRAYVDDTNRQKAVLEIANLYPVPYGDPWEGTPGPYEAPSGERVAITGYAENKGSVPVKFAGAKLEIISDENDVADTIKADIRISKRVSNSWTPLHWARKVPLKELEDHFNNPSNGIIGTVLGTGDRLGFGQETMYIYMDGEADTEGTHDSELKFTLEFDFIQWNAP